MTLKDKAWRGTWPLYVVFFIVVAPVLLLRDFTPDNELRYLSIADEALRNHSFFAFSNHGIPYADKPPLYLWIVMALRQLLGSHQMWALGLVSLLPALATVYTMDRWVAETLDDGARRCGRWLLLTSAFFLGAALTVRMDMLMCWFIVLSLRSFWHIYSRDAHYRRSRWTFGLFVFLALFTKGPLGVLIPLCSTVAFLAVRRQWSRLAEVWGWHTWTVLLAGCALWFGAVWTDGGSAYLDNLLFHQTLDRAVHAFHHNRPCYYYLVCLWYCVAPWSLLAVLSMGLLLKQKGSTSDLQLFFPLVALVILLLLSAISGKLQIYMLPAIPFMAYSAAYCLPAFPRSWHVRLCLALPAFVLVASLPVLLTVGRNTPFSAFLFHPAVVCAAAMLSLGGIAALLALLAGPGQRSSYKSVEYMAKAVMAAVFVASLVLPKVNPLTGYGPLCNVAKDVARQEGLHAFLALDLKNAADMDAYLSAPVTTLASGSEAGKVLKDKVLLMMPCRYKPLANGYRQRQVGNWLVVVGGSQVQPSVGEPAVQSPKKVHQ